MLILRGRVFVHWWKLLSQKRCSWQSCYWSPDNYKQWVMITSSEGVSPFCAVTAWETHNHRALGFIQSQKKMFSVTNCCHYLDPRTCLLSHYTSGMQGITTLSETRAKSQKSPRNAEKLTHHVMFLFTVFKESFQDFGAIKFNSFQTKKKKKNNKKPTYTWSC